MDDTLNYYDNNADLFFSDTSDLAFSEVQDRFLSLLKGGSKILDFGCGSGRDSKYFLQKGFKVDAIDGSLQMCRMASRLTGLNVEHMMFQDLSISEVYDGIWACASILHVPAKDLKNIFQKIATALKPSGICYASFKYGEWEGERNGRYFTDMTEERIEAIIAQIEILQIKDLWITSDIRKGREDEQWINFILIKNFRNQIL